MSVRVKKMKVTPAVVMAFARDGQWDLTVESALSEDAKLMSVAWDPLTQVFWLYVTDPEFPEIQSLGDPIPELPPISINIKKHEGAGDDDNIRSGENQQQPECSSSRASRWIWFTRTIGNLIAGLRGR